MDELIGQVTQKAGISSDQAKSAVQAVLAFLKGKLPAVIGDQLDGAVGGGGGGSPLDAVKKGIGGMVGK